jgi:D-alanine--poly(phosphoribitol) ligase subunit 1
LEKSDIANCKFKLSLINSINSGGDSIAIVTPERAYSYYEFKIQIAKYIGLFKQNNISDKLGIINHHDFYTYSAIVACIISGITYIPIEPTHPVERNKHIIDQTDIKHIFCSSDTDLSENELISKLVLKFEGQNNLEDELDITFTNNPVYILFTSGTTGIPKGVPIYPENLNSFVDIVFSLPWDISSKSKFLQVFDLTFDLSVFSFLIPFIAGASLYISDSGAIKNLVAINSIMTNKITHVLTVPSFITLLMPYFNRISLPEVEHWFFCGEALSASQIQKWQNCVPKAKIWNLYGPTEATIFCTSYYCQPNNTKQYNDIVCIGKPFENTKFYIHKTDDDNLGELYISGSQTVKSYLNNADKEQFTTIDDTFYYKSADLVFKDEQGDYFFVGRNDSQIKIQGYRIELGEIEHAALKHNSIKQAAAVCLEQGDNKIIALAIVADANLYNEDDFISFLGENLPKYMIPKKIELLYKMPYNLNGKIDRKYLKKTLADTANDK